MILYGISSYHRPQCRTAQTLLDMGIPADSILIHLNAEEDIPAYEAVWGGAVELRYAKGNCVACNRNGLIRAAHGGELVLLDDDVKSFKKLNPNRGKYGAWEKLSGDELNAIVHETFEKCRQEGARGRRDGYDNRVLLHGDKGFGEDERELQED